MKKILASILIALSLFSLVSCRGNQGGKAPEKVALENVYLAEKIALSGQDVYNIIISGDDFYFQGNKQIEKTDENGEKYTNYADVIYHSSDDFSTLTEVYVHENDYFWDEKTYESHSSYINSLSPDGKGNLWVNIISYRNYPKDPVTLDEWVNETENTLIKYDKDANLIRTVEFTPIYNSIPDLTDLERQNPYINGVFETPDGKLIIALNRMIVVVDENDSIIKTKTYEDDEYYYDFSMTDEGNLRTISYDWSGSVTSIKVIEYNLNSNEFLEISSFESNDSVFMSKNGDLYTNDYNVISRVDLETGEETPILDFINSDINCDRIGNLIIIGDEIYTFEYDTNYENRSLLRLTPAGEGDVVEKYVMTLAANYVSSDLKNMIIDYNRSSAEHRITVKAYGWEEGATEQFDLDLLSGKVPDIICLEDLDPSKYATKGILADLGALMDADDEISRDDFLPNVLEAGSIKGKIYRMPTSFAVRTLVGKTSIIGDKGSWTWDEFLSLKKKYPDSLLLDYTERMIVLDSYLPIFIEDFVDYRNGKTNFTDGSFARFLEFVKDYPATIDWDKYYEDLDWEVEDAKYREDRVLLQPSYLSTFEGHTYIAQNFGEPVSYIAFPSSQTGKGDAIVFSAQFAIGASSRYKNEAWDFLKMILSEDYQMNYVWDFPVLKSAFEAKKEETLKNWVESGEYDDSYIPDDDMAILPMPKSEIAIDDVIGMPRPPIYEEEEYLRVTKESIERVYNLVINATRLVRYNDPVIDMIKSEVEPYFDGKKSLEETCKIIESKVSLYLAENM